MRRLIAATAAVLATLGFPSSAFAEGLPIGSGSTPSPPPSSGVAGGAVASGDVVTTWAVSRGAPTGGHRAGADGKPCSYSLLAINGLAPVPGVIIDNNDPGAFTQGGQHGHLYRSSCPPNDVVFVPDYSPEDLAKVAYQETIRTLTSPTPVFAPPLAKGGYVNLKTWMGVRPTASVTADAFVPGLTVRATAVPDHIEWDPGDGTTVACTDLGAIYVPDGPTVPECGWTAKYPSAPKFTGTSDLHYHGSFRLVWHITWTSSTGAAGDLGFGVTHTETAYKVYEIQTIGDG